MIAALDRKRTHFQAFLAEQKEQRTRLDAHLLAFLKKSQTEIEEILDRRGITWSGALPTAELDQAQRLRLPFAGHWSSHEDARRWARDVLLDRTVIAVDGSQITPTKDLSVPVGAIQVGWFVNAHNEEGHYVKDVDFDVVAPGELQGDDDDGAPFPNWYVNQQRFVAECRKLCELMEENADRPDEEKPICFFDGSFIISFASQMLPRRSNVYLQAVANLLDCSAHTRIPLVGFVDGSFSRDIVRLIDCVIDGGSEHTITDAALAGSLLPHWGDRTPLFVCARDDALSREGRATFYADVAFSYMRVTADRPPARVELPRWVMEEGRAEHVLDVVRAECVVGMGYPYAIEAADALAVISQPDRERFHALFQQFAEQQGVHLTLARKALSKRQRRN